jgi:hypothetical protein
MKWKEDIKVEKSLREVKENNLSSLAILLKIFPPTNVNFLIKQGITTYGKFNWVRDLEGQWRLVTTERNRNEKYIEVAVAGMETEVIFNT